MVTGLTGIAEVRNFTDLDNFAAAAGDAVYDAAVAIADSYGLFEVVSYEGDAKPLQRAARALLEI